MYSEAKLGEARYFLRKLRATHHAEESFPYILSATVSAFRGVTFAIQAEFAKFSQCKKIYEGLQGELRADPFAVAMRDARNDQQKQGHLWPRIVLVHTDPAGGRTLEHEGAPLPAGFDRLRRGVLLTSPERGIKLTGNIEEDREAVFRGYFMSVLQCAHERWPMAVKIRVHDDHDAISREEFLDSIDAWLNRIDEVIRQMRRSQPVNSMHHVLSQGEAALIARIGQGCAVDAETT